MNGSARDADPEHELRELHRRAYGPHPDIADDPVALARLAELERARSASGEPAAISVGSNGESGVADGVHAQAISSTAVATVADPVPVEEPANASAPPTAHRKGVWMLAVGVFVAAVVIAASTMPEWGSSPDALLHATAAAPDDELITLLDQEGGDLIDRSELRGASEQEIDVSTLRAFGTYRTVEIWSAVNAFQSRCLIAVHRPTTDIIARSCVPAGVDLFVDTVYHGLPAGDVLRFTLHGDEVVVDLLQPEEAGS